MKKIFALLIALMIFLPVENCAAVEWFWLDSNDKYSKYFEPDSVTVKKKVVTSDGREIAIEIEAWTKTTYSYNGAAETIKNYGIANILPDPKNLAYSLALLRVNPQNRTLQYGRRARQGNKYALIRRGILLRDCRRSFSNGRARPQTRPD